MFSTQPRQSLDDSRQLLVLPQRDRSTIKFQIEDKLTITCEVVHVRIL